MEWEEPQMTERWIGDLLNKRVAGNRRHKLLYAVARRLAHVGRDHRFDRYIVSPCEYIHYMAQMKVNNSSSVAKTDEHVDLEIFVLNADVVIRDTIRGETLFFATFNPRNGNTRAFNVRSIERGKWERLLLVKHRELRKIIRKSETMTARCSF